MISSFEPFSKSKYIKQRNIKANEKIVLKIKNASKI